MDTLYLPAADDTFALGQRLGLAAFPGAVVALVGDLGAGKTLLTQGLADALGVQGPVQSPTFILVSEHDDGRLPLFHADLYRLDDATALEQTGLSDVLGVEGVSVVEWADKHPELLPDDHLRIELAYGAEGPTSGRRAHVVATGPRHAGMARAARG